MNQKTVEKYSFTLNRDDNKRLLQDNDKCDKYVDLTRIIYIDYISSIQKECWTINIGT